MKHSRLIINRQENEYNEIGNLKLEIWRKAPISNFKFLHINVLGHKKLTMN
jgi:hypothetical protein